MKFNRISRRHCLQGLGGVGLALPILESLTSRVAVAAPPAPATRFVAIKSSNGQRDMYWNPKTLPAMTQTGESIRHAPLSAFAGGVNPICATFAPHHAKMNFVQGLDVIPGLGHNRGGMLGNFNDFTPTIDQVMAYSSKVYPVEPAIRSLLLGCPPADNGSFSYNVSSGTLVQLPAYRSVEAAFDRVFFSASPEQARHQQTIVDRVYQDYQALRESPRLSKNDRLTLDRHLTTVQELQTRLRTQVPLTLGQGRCPSDPLGARPVSGVPDASSLMDIEQYYRDLCDLIVVAFACSATKVATLQVEFPKSFTPNDYHGHSHSPEEEPNPVELEINQWIAEKIVRELVQRLDVAEADGATYLDNSVVFWGNEISLGNAHRSENMPAVLFGSAGGKLTTGNFISYWNPAGTKVPMVVGGRPYNQLLVSLLQSMGLEPADYEQPGQPGYGAASTTDPDRSAYYAPFLSQVGQPLPVLSV
jgi:hypothetical protein